MIFGPEDVARAEGAILAHSVQAGERKLKKGTVLGAQEVAALAEAGIARVTVARPEDGDVLEDEAARRLADALGAEGAHATRAATGRVNLVADRPGVVRIDTDRVAAINAVDPAITLATLPDHTRVSEGMLLATAKIIPYGVAGAALDRAEAAAAGAPVIRVAAPVIDRAALIVTRTPGYAEKLLRKGREAVEERLASLGVRLVSAETVPHETEAVAAAVARADAPLTLILGASATSDAADVCPAAVVAAGGRLTRFGMPVDPGNLLFLGELSGAHVVGLPGCARSPALNGADWVLERLVCGLRVGSAEIAAMGVGGLLKEIPTRPQPRIIAPEPKGAERWVEVVLLAAGRARRMQGTDKLLEEVGGEPLLRRAARAALASRAAAVHVVLPPGAEARRAALEGLEVDVVEAPAAAEGMGGSLRTGIAALDARAEAAIVALADMPEIDAAAHDALIAAFDPGKGAEICRATAPDGTPGHPVLFGRRFFESLADLGGDRGAREILTEAAEFVRDVALPGQAALTDLDTPEDWRVWRARQGSAA